ncbi:ABC transporter [Rhodobacterales bacterium 59_46_T64]|nr:ABC transporter [Rhodobacterales bacterium 59_46_T64]
MSKFSRRMFAQTAFAALGMTAFAAPQAAWALNDAQAKALVDKTVAEINRVISSGQSLGRMISDFERIFTRYADVNIIARSTLGPDSRRASAAQMRAFTTAFRGYVARKYGKRFNEFVGGVITVQGVRKVKSYHEVVTMVKLKGEAPFDVKFLVSDKSGKDLFFDMIIEGISLRLTERTEIGSMLDRRRGDIDGLIEDLKKAG